MWSASVRVTIRYDGAAGGHAQDPPACLWSLLLCVCGRERPFSVAANYPALVGPLDHFLSNGWMFVGMGAVSSTGMDCFSAECWLRAQSI